MIKQTGWAILCCAALALAAQDEPVISFRLTPVKAAVNAGETVTVDAVADFPQGFRIVAWKATCFTAFAPRNLAEKTGIPVSRSGDQQWNYISIRDWTYLPGEVQLKKEHRISFPTRNWPAGDYRIDVMFLFKSTAANGQPPELYRGSFLYLNIAE